MSTGARRLTLALTLALLLLAPASALGHATLQGTQPLSGAVVKKEPGQISFRFNESVEGNFGAIRVYDRKGGRVLTARAARRSIPAAPAIVIA